MRKKSITFFAWKRAASQISFTISNEIGVHPQVVNIEGVPVTPVGANQAVERVHKMDVPVDRHVGDPMGTSEVPIVLVAKLSDYEVTSGGGAFT